MKLNFCLLLALIIYYVQYFQCSDAHENNEIFIYSLVNGSNIGDLYNANSGQFIGTNIFGNRLANLSVQSNSVGDDDQNINIAIVYNVHDKFNHFQLTSLQKLHLLAQSIKVDDDNGANKYLLDHQSSTNVQVAFIKTIKSKSQHVNLDDDSVKAAINWESLLHTSATHVVVGIEWGTRLIAAIGDSNSGNKNSAIIGNQLERTVQTVYNNVEINGQFKSYNNKINNINLFDYRFKLFTDIKPDTTPVTIVDAISYVKYYKTDHAKQLNYKIMPISHLISLMTQTKPNYKTIAKQIDNEIVDKFVQLFYNMITIEQQFNDYIYGKQSVKDRLSVANLTELKHDFVLFKNNFSKKLIELLNKIDTIDDNDWSQFVNHYDVSHSKVDEFNSKLKKFQSLVSTHHQLIDPIVSNVNRSSTLSSSSVSLQQTKTSKYYNENFIYICGGNYKNKCYKYDIRKKVWQQIASMNYGRRGFSLITLYNQLFAIEGLNDEPYYSVEVYDPYNNFWRLGSSLNIKRQYYGATVLYNNIYVCGGSYNDWIKSCEYYTPSTDEWMFSTPLTSGRSELALVAHDGYIYAIGGRDNSNYGLDLVERFNTQNKIWSRMANMLFKRTQCASASFMGSIYVCGGIYNTNDSYYYTNSCEKYDSDKNQWTSIANMTTSRSDFHLLVYNDKLYAIGDSSQIDVYDYQSDIWTNTVSLPNYNYEFGAAIL
ncbi:uncharacterized protein LOC128957570 [Oppia nitens]|uniref:uncharacterized protein LOC128957570 n=1 Tax=Oppia nitens TaxID=1686743 RepID=UPI0023DB8B28|nr:uncharacterized protein LOC128957570 [Oppia nitens]